MKLHYLPAFISTVVLTGCASVVQPVQIATPQKLEPLKSTMESSKTIFVSNFSAKIVDKKIGQMTVGTWCVSGQDLIWGEKPAVLARMKEQVSLTLEKNGYKTYSGLIQASGERESDILIGGAIEDLKANICYSVNGERGAASVKLVLEVLDNKTKKSIFLTGTGAHEIKEFDKTGDPEILLRAVAMATENILAQPEFHALTRK